MNEHVIIVAGGRGNRMRKSIPKQFIKIGGFPILMRTVNAFYRYSYSIRIILVLPEGEIGLWKTLCEEFSFNVPHQIQKGGKTRQESVRNGLELVGEEGLVAIHDGVRPFVTEELISLGFKRAKITGNAVASVPLKDSLRIIAGEENRYVDRALYRLIQTPQTFLVSQIKEAYRISISDFTDDASVAENAGFKIELIEGNYDNIKITTEEDLLLADVLLNKRGNYLPDQEKAKSLPGSSDKD